MYMYAPSAVKSGSTKLLTGWKSRKRYIELRMFSLVEETISVMIILYDIHIN